MQFVVIVWEVTEYYWNILKLGPSPLASNLYKAVLKNKKRSEGGLTALFSAWFLKKITFVIFY